MEKYHNLGIFLGSIPVQEVTMTFAQIQRVIAAKLPKSA